MAPNTVIPSAEPIVRKNVINDDDVPLYCGGTAFSVEMFNREKETPMPSPTMIIKSEMTRRLDAVSITKPRSDIPIIRVNADTSITSR
ncbi:hypothetical protein D3C84_948150 [compost metagenome]